MQKHPQQEMRWELAWVLFKARAHGCGALLVRFEVIGPMGRSVEFILEEGGAKEEPLVLTAVVALIHRHRRHQELGTHRLRCGVE